MKSREVVVVGFGLALFGAIVCSADPLDNTKIDTFSKLMAKLTGVAGFTMRADAMEPTIMPGDTIVAPEEPYRKADPQPGDIIVFTYPADTSVAFVSRVIALGDTTVEVRDGLTVVGGHIIREDYVPDREKKTPDSRTVSVMHVPAGSLFVMADNRDHSEDSRYKGLVPRSLVIGKVMKILRQTHSDK
jgi:signal peptidase I